ncbi:hypothetical protein RIF29_16360 [Crotalaria pallida]|uniref:Uncharacterized protein n=1 Tax=Crotalaria pallida TaxID=3830 RepID=A0AAN9FKX7_CROPI
MDIDCEKQCKTGVQKKKWVAKADKMQEKVRSILAKTDVEIVENTVIDQNAQIFTSTPQVAVQNDKGVLKLTLIVILLEEFG